MLVMSSTTGTTSTVGGMLAKDYAAPSGTHIHSG
jgi:hypothetical protein